MTSTTSEAAKGPQTISPQVKALPPHPHGHRSAARPERWRLLGGCCAQGPCHLPAKAPALLT